MKIKHKPVVNPSKVYFLVCFFPAEQLDSERILIYFISFSWKIAFVI